MLTETIKTIPNIQTDVNLFFYFLMYGFPSSSSKSGYSLWYIGLNEKYISRK